ETKSHPAVLFRIGLKFIEDFRKTVGGDAGAGVAYPATNLIHFDRFRSDRNLTTRGVLYGVGQEVLKDLSDEDRVRMHNAMIRHGINNLDWHVGHQRAEIPYQRLHERP